MLPVFEIDKLRPAGAILQQYVPHVKGCFPAEEVHSIISYFVVLFCQWLSGCNISIFKLQANMQIVTRQRFVVNFIQTELI